MPATPIDTTIPTNNPTTTDLPQLSPYAESIAKETVEALYHTYHNEPIEKQVCICY